VTTQVHIRHYGLGKLFVKWYYKILKRFPSPLPLPTHTHGIRPSNMHVMHRSLFRWGDWDF